MSEEITSSVDEFIKFMKWILNADPISSLQIAGVKSMSPSMRYIVVRGLECLSALQQAMKECNAKRMNDKCVMEVLERRVGLDYETVMNAIKNLSTVATNLRSFSRNAQRLVALATKYILLGERREVRYHIGGWLDRGGFEISRLRGGGDED